MAGKEIPLAMFCSSEPAHQFSEVKPEPDIMKSEFGLDTPEDTSTLDELELDEQLDVQETENNYLGSVYFHTIGLKDHADLQPKVVKPMTSDMVCIRTEKLTNKAATSTEYNESTSMNKDEISDSVKEVVSQSNFEFQSSSTDLGVFAGLCTHVTPIVIAPIESVTNEPGKIPWHSNHEPVVNERHSIQRHSNHDQEPVVNEPRPIPWHSNHDPVVDKLGTPHGSHGFPESSEVVLHSSTECLTPVSSNTTENPIKCELETNKIHSLVSKVELNPPQISDKPYRCQICAISFSKEYELKGHTCKQDQNEVFMCYGCGKKFAGKWQLNEHCRRHKWQNHHRCKVCGESFHCNSSLLYHTRRHTGEKPYKCDVCEKAFFHKHTLASHKSIHTGEKPHVCNVCGKAFCRKGDLGKHNRIHTAEKPYKCDVCGKAYTRQSQLLAHKKSHGDERCQ